MIVVGVKYLSFPDRNAPDKTVSGVQLFCGYPITENGEGISYGKNGGERLFLSEWMLANRLGGAVPKIGDEIEPIRDASGKLMKIIPVASAPASK